MSPADMPVSSNIILKANTQTQRSSISREESLGVGDFLMNVRAPYLTQLFQEIIWKTIALNFRVYTLPRYKYNFFFQSRKFHKISSTSSLGAFYLPPTSSVNEHREHLQCAALRPLQCRKSVGTSIFSRIISCCGGLTTWSGSLYAAVAAR